MRNEKLINEVVKTVIDYYEFEHICENTKDIRKRAEWYYDNTDVVECQPLAALVLTGDLLSNLTFLEIKKIEEFYFPETPLELTEFSIGEIEASLKDGEWR